MDGLIGALIGGFFTAIVTYLGWKRASEETAKNNMAQYRKNQIDEFYGPLLGYLRYSQEIFDIARQKLPTKEGEDGLLHVDTSQFSRTRNGIEHSKIWDFFHTQYFMRINSDVVRLLNQKRYYAETPDLNEIIDAFLDHESHGNCLHNMWTHLNEPSDEITDNGYPKGFEELVAKEYGELNREYRTLSGIC
ncbi:MAG: hypothetical protein R3F42_09005 [Pseudomonadota bacterium]